MKALWKTESGDLSFRNLPEPTVKDPDDVKIRVKYNTIGVYDLRMFVEGGHNAKQGVAGTEMSGVIVDLGDQAIVDGFSLGDRVSGMPLKFCGKCYYCLRHKESCCVNIISNPGTLSEYVVWKSSQLVRLSDSISDRTGCLVEPVSTAIETVERMNVGLGSTVAILGGSFTGLAILQLVRMRGASNVTVVESTPFRQELARSLGANHIVDPADPDCITQLLNLTDFNGFDYVVETTGDPNIMETMLDFVARGGTVVLRSCYEMNRRTHFDPANIFFNNITVIGAFLYNLRLSSTIGMMPLLRVEELVSEEFAFRRAIEAFAAQKEKEYPRTGIIM
jgi:(R,R)-butanediol dehydrogenase/meso-butanediol dehydrogenase/diacetyl reductase/L-iditol 2-dehydrogenase